MDPWIAAFLGGAQAIPGWQGLAAAAAPRLAATQTSGAGGVRADLASLLALQSAQLQMQQQHRHAGHRGGTRGNTRPRTNFAAAGR